MREDELQKVRTSLLKMALEAYPVGVDNAHGEQVADILIKAFARVNKVYLEKRRVRRVAESAGKRALVAGK